MVKISIVTSTFNAASTLCSCLNSVNIQTVNAEQFLIDGCSDDGTLDIIRENITPLRHFTSEPDTGIYDAMNKGICHAKGNIIGILNADDFYFDNQVLERVANVFVDPTVDACYGDLIYIKENDPPLANKQSSPFKVLRYWKSGPFVPEKFKWGWMPPHPTFFVRREVYEKYGLFNLALGSAADYELMLRFLLKHRINVAYIPEVLVCMRVGGVSNASIKNRIKANRMDRKAWEVNGLKPYPWTIPLKPIRKISQYWMRPPNWQTCIGHRI